MTTVITGMWGDAFARYGRDFVVSFDRFWPAEVNLLVFTERPVVMKEIRRRNVIVYDMAETNGWSDFMARHRDDVAAHGRAPSAAWKPEARRAGYNFRFDAAKFAGQAFVPEAAARTLPDGELMTWLDADVRTFADVPRGFLDGLVPPPYNGAYLGRAPKHSEIGYWAVRLNERTRAFLEYFRRAYDGDHVFRMKEWHSAFVWDQCRTEMDPKVGLRMRDLTPGGRGHVWFQSPLGQYLDHLKGKRKERGRSPERR